MAISVDLSPSSVQHSCLQVATLLGHAFVAHYRWRIENNILVEKHQGYSYEHCLSYNWNAMKGYHYLMKIGHFINVLVVNSELLIEQVRRRGVQRFIEFLYMALAGAPLDKEGLDRGSKARYQLRFVL